MNTLAAARAAGYVLLAVVAAWAGARVYKDRMTPASAVAVSVPIGQASPPNTTDLVAESPQTGPLSTTIPDKLPGFTLSDLHGIQTPIAKWRGKSLVLNFWATWCAPCRREIPLLKTLSAQWAARDIEVIGVAVDYPDKVSQYALDMKIPYPVLVGEQEALDVAASLGVTTPVFPFTVFTDRRDEVVALYVGELREPQAALILSVVESLNRGQTSVVEARRFIAQHLQRLPEDGPT